VTGRLLVRSSIVVLTSALFLSMMGCGPQFFSAKGTVDSSGGAFGKWSASPAMCSRDEFNGDSSQLVTFMFGAPKNDDPDRDVHPGSRQVGPMTLKIAKDGDAYMAKLMTNGTIDTGNPMDAMKNMQGVTLDPSSCKTFTFDRSEHMNLGHIHKPLSGHVVMDCTKYNSHITADFKFSACD
jgi:hypothetical protein